MCQVGAVWADWMNEKPLKTRDDYLCEWQPSERDKRLYGLATSYHTDCEAYDRTVCTGPVREGLILPMTPHERALVNQNALRVKRRLEADAARECITPVELQRAINKLA